MANVSVSFEIGDAVVLKTGSVRMTIDGIWPAGNQTKVRCVWYCPVDRLFNTHEFDVEAVKLAE